MGYSTKVAVGTFDSTAFACTWPILTLGQVF